MGRSAFALTKRTSLGLASESGAALLVRPALFIVVIVVVTMRMTARSNRLTRALVFSPLFQCTCLTPDIPDASAETHNFDVNTDVTDVFLFCENRQHSGMRGGGVKSESQMSIVFVCPLINSSTGCNKWSRDVAT